MGDWQVSLHAVSAENCSTKTVEWNGRSIEALDISPLDLREPFDFEFDEFVNAINQLDGGYAEGDGSFGICGPQGSWKVVGTIYEAHGKIQYIELIGNPLEPALSMVSDLLTKGRFQVSVQILLGGFFVSVPVFRALSPPI